MGSGQANFVAARFPPPATVDEALDFYWRDRSQRRGHIPDYAGFSEWVDDQMAKAKAASILPLHGSSVRTPVVEFAHQLVSAVGAAGIVLTPSAATPDPAKFGQPYGKRSRLKCLNRAKLLLAHASKAPSRTREMYMLFARPPEEWATARTVNRQSSQSDLRVAFFDAIYSRDAYLAFKLVGRLREEGHDPGEVAFLEATASFHANRLHEAIDIARSVPRDTADWPRAFMLLLEALALQGDITGIEVEIGHNEHRFELPLFFLPYVCQVAIENSESPEDCFEHAIKIIDTDFDPRQSAPGAYQLWNRQSCKLAMRYIEQQQSLALRSQAVDQSDSG